MSIEETDSEDVELQPADSGRTSDRETVSAARPAGAVPLTRSALQFADADMDDEDEPEIDFEQAGIDEPQSQSGIDPATWILRLVELLLVTAILYLFL